MADGRWDDVDSVAFDEDFVRGATIHELDHRARRKAARRDRKAGKAPRRRRRPRDRSRLRRRLKQPSWAEVASVTFFFSLSGVLIAGALGVGPAAFLAGSIGIGDDPDTGGAGADVRSADLASSPSPNDTAITTTTLHDLEGGSFRRGACIIWDEEERARTDASVDNVPCSEPHYLEVTGTVELPGRMNYPTAEATWNVLSAERCEGLTAKHLGYSLVRTGRFYTTALHPTDGGWRAGDRSLQCGIASRPGYDFVDGVSTAPAATGEANQVPFTGTVQGQSQEVVPPAGTCFQQVGPDEKLTLVPCSAAHHLEVTGHLGLAERALDHPPTDADQAGRIGDDCRGLAARYLGRRLRRDESASWMPISAEEWAAGFRTLPCTVGRWVNEQWTPVQGSLAAQ